MKIKWITTDEVTYSVIWLKHKDQLKVFGTFTNTESNSRFGNPKKLTEWGFVDSDIPLMKSVADKSNDDQEKWDYRYYMAYAVKDADEEIE